MAEFKLGRIKFVWKGPWQTSSNYYKDDVVSYGGISYICVASHTAGNFDTDLANNWQKMAGGTDFKGNWANATVYKQGDVVKYNANNYICILGHTSATNTAEPPNATYWTVYTNSVFWRGNWAASTDYKLNDLVNYGANVYICTVDHTSGLTFVETNWDVFILGLEFQDTWNDSAIYVPGDIVTYGGYAYVASNQNVNSTPSTSSSNWDLLTTGFNVVGTWNSVTVYKTGDVVQFGGWSYVCLVQNSNQRPYIGTTGINTTYWQLVVRGLATRGSYSNLTLYGPGDIVESGSSSYAAIATVQGITPPNAVYWQLLSQAGLGFSLTARGDIAYREASGAVIGLKMSNGTYPGSAVQEGFVLKARNVLTPTPGLEPRWEEYGYVTNVWYVAPNGTDNVSNGYGRTLDRPFATIKYACQQASSGSTIFIKTGNYYEQLPISVPANVSLVGDELRTTFVYPAPGLSDDGITPNNRSRMFLVNNATTLRNLSMGGLTGTIGAVENPAGSGVFRLNVNWPSTSASGAYVSFDPTGSISSKSPYIQNCSTFGSRAVGAYLDGDLHAGGYKSMTFNDFTQVVDDGIGVWATNGARAELVSVFTYYSYIGYLAEQGGILRALNGNNSYGNYGVVAVDIDPTDSGFSGTVNNRDNEATVSKVWIGEGRVLAAAFSYQGEQYTSASVSFDSAPIGGTNIVAAADIQNGVISHVRVTSGGANYQYVTGTARQGGTSGSGIYLALASTDQASLNNQYQGMRITIIDGLGSGQTAIIKNSLLTDIPSGFTKVVYLEQTPGGPNGWTSLTGDPIITNLDASSQYEITPEITVTGGTPSRTAILRAQIDPETYTMTGVYILDGGVGYTAPLTFTVVDPQNSAEATFSGEIKNGAISRLTYANRGAGYVTVAAPTITGDGYAEIAQSGQVLKFLGLTQSPRPGSILTIQGQAGNFLVIETTFFNIGTGAATISVSTPISTATPLVHGNTVTCFEKFSQVRLTGHDYLAIGTGNFASTAYPNVSTLNYIRTNEKLSLNNGRVFYVSTDQDGNLSVGDLFQVNQATGSATLNVTNFSLTGLNSLQLLGGAAISQFSTDGTLSANSDSIVPTQRAIRSYISSQLGSGSNNLEVNVLTAGKVYIQNNVITTSPGTASDLEITADGSGVIRLIDTTNYTANYATIKTLTSSSVVNRDYVDNEFRETLHGFYLDPNGNLFYTTDIGTELATIDGSAYTDFFIGSRNTSVAISNAGNLQITY
jgi:hypothetical protein